MKKTLVFLLFIPQLLYAQEMLWASDVLFMEGVDSARKVNFKQILGYPNSVDVFSKNACTFRLNEAKNNPIQEIRVSFGKITSASQIIIAQNYNSGAIVEVSVYDSLGISKKVYSATPRGYISLDYGEFLGINIPSNYRIKEVAIKLNLSYLVDGVCQLDAVGLLSNDRIKDIEYQSYVRNLFQLNPDFRKKIDEAAALTKSLSPSLGDLGDGKSNRPAFLPKSMELYEATRNYKIQWARVTDEFSSQDSSGYGYFARNVIGIPSFSPAKNLIFSWTPQTKLINEFIKMKYIEPQTVSDVFVFTNGLENQFEGIILYDKENKPQDKFKFTDKNVTPILNRVWHLHLPKPTDYEVASIKLIINGTGIILPQIDAIGISNEKYLINTLDLSGYKISKENLGKNINSHFREVAPLISYDGKTMFFVREGHEDNIGKYRNQDVWVSKFNKKDWEKAVNLGEPINNDEHNAIGTTSITAKTVYLLNEYSTDGTSKKGLSKSNFINGKWSFPSRLNIKNYYNLNDFTEFSFAPNGNTLLIACERKDSFGEKDLYVSFLQNDSTWSEPLNMGDSLNTQFSESTPFIAADCKTLYFSTKGHLGYGDNDIFMSRRLDDTWLNWSKPINLGNKINSKLWDGYFTVPASGEYAYTSSDEKTMGAEDIFRIALPQPLRPSPVAIINGNFGNFKVLKVEVKEIDNPKETYLADIDSETNEYTLILPVNKKYNLTVIHSQNLIYQSIIDLSEHKYYIEIKKDINLQNQPEK
ncbi:MAG: sialidase family protein [Spirosomataceae bacterium]